MHVVIFPIDTFLISFWDVSKMLGEALEDLPFEVRQVLLTVETAFHGLCQRMREMRDTESIESVFTSSNLRNLTMIIENLPGVVDMLFENVMSEEVDSYLMKTPPMEVMHRVSSEICQGNSSLFITNPDGQKAISVLCAMDWNQVATDFMDEIVNPSKIAMMAKEPILSGKFSAQHVAQSVMCIYGSILETNWTKIVNESKFMAIGEVNLDNL